MVPSEAAQPLHAPLSYGPGAEAALWTRVAVTPWAEELGPFTDLVFKLLRKECRRFTHPPAAMLGVLADRGLRRTFAHHTLVWQVAGLER